MDIIIPNYKEFVDFVFAQCHCMVVVVHLDASHELKKLIVSHCFHLRWQVQGQIILDIQSSPIVVFQFLEKGNVVIEVLLSISCYT